MLSFVALVIELAIYAVLWSLLYEVLYRTSKVPSAILKIEDKKQQALQFYSYLSYLPALLHAPITTGVSLVALVWYGLGYNLDIRGFEVFPLKYSASFFIYDTINGIRRKYNDNMVLAHHVFITIVIFWALWFGKYGSELCNGIAQGEITNPLYAAYDIMGFWGVAESKTRPIGIAFMGSFIFIRVCIAPFLMIQVQSSDSDLFFKATYTCMWIISMLLIWMMINKIAKLLSQVGIPHQGHARQPIREAVLQLHESHSSVQVRV